MIESDLTSPEQIEEERLRLVQEFNDYNSNSDVEIPSPSSNDFYHHEVLDRSSLMIANWSDFIVEHPYVIFDPELFALAYEIDEKMANFYQKVGAKNIWGLLMALKLR